MQTNYKRIGDYIQLVNKRNKNLEATELFGINIDKYFMPSVANVVGTDLSRYKIVQKNQFACNRMHVGRDYRIPIALSDKNKPFMISPAYDVFEIKDTSVLMPEYLMMWFSRKEFDRNAWFYTDADVRGGLAWDAFCNIQLPVPSIETQGKIVAEYNTVKNRIELNNQLIQKLEETAQAIYKQWFVEEANKEKVFLKEYIITNPKLELKKGCIAKYIEMANLSETSMCINGIAERKYNGGSKFQNNDTLLARITPCLENGKTAFVDVLTEHEVAAGSTEFIVMRAKENTSPFLVYCIAKDEDFRSFAISSMIGSSGRQRVHEDYLGSYKISRPDPQKMNLFHNVCDTIFTNIKIKSSESKSYQNLLMLLLSKLSTMKN